MKASEIRDLSQDELEAKSRELRDDFSSGLEGGHRHVVFSRGPAEFRAIAGQRRTREDAVAPW